MHPMGDRPGPVPMETAQADSGPLGTSHSGIPPGHRRATIVDHATPRRKESVRVRRPRTSPPLVARADSPADLLAQIRREGDKTA